MVGNAYRPEDKHWVHPENVDLEGVVKKVHDRTEIVIPIKPTETYTDKFEKRVHTLEFEQRRQTIQNIHSKYEHMMGSSNIIEVIIGSVRDYFLKHSADFNKYFFDWDINKNKPIDKP